MFDYLIISTATSALGFDFSDGTFAARVHSEMREVLYRAPTVPAGTPGAAGVSSAQQIMRAFTPVSGARNAVFCLADEPLALQAPAAAQALMAQITWDWPHGYVYHCDGADLWVIGLRAEALLRGMYHLFDSCGWRMYGPHPAWTNSISHVAAPPALSTYRRPSMHQMFWFGDGNLSSPATLAGGAESPVYWTKWWQALGLPREYSGGSAGNSSVLIRNQCSAREDRKMLGWNPNAPGGGQRGYADGGAFPLTCDDGTNSKIHIIKPCPTHHGSGAPGATYPSAPAGPDTWTGGTLPEQCDPGVTECSVIPDPTPDSSVSPNMSDFTSFDGWVKLRSEDFWNALCVSRQTEDIWGPSGKSSSATPPDGGDHCQCDKCLAISPDDRSNSEFHGANEVAKFVAHMDQNSDAPEHIVFMRAYSETINVPSIPIEPNLGVRLVIHASGLFNNRTFEERSAGWGEKYTEDNFLVMGIAPSWLLNGDNLDAPRLSPQFTSACIGRWLDEGFDDFAAESSFSNIVFGFHVWAASRWMWGDRAPIETLLDERFAGVFTVPAVRSPIERMYRRWWGNFEWSAQEVALTWADLEEAQDAADAAGVVSGSNLQQVVTHHCAYAWYQQRFCEMLVAEANASGLVVAPVTIATTTNVVLSGFQTIQSVSIDAASKTVCATGQTNPAENGVWAPNASTWTRVSHLNSAAELLTGVCGTIVSGTYAGQYFRHTTAGTITLGTTPLTFVVEASAPALLADLRTGYDNVLRAAWYPTQFNMHFGQNCGDTLEGRMGARLVSDPLIAYWEHEDSGAAAWAASAVPTEADMRAAIAAGVAAYTPIASVSRTTFSDDLVPNVVSVDTTQVNGFWFDTESYYRIMKPAGDVTIAVLMQDQGGTSNKPLRVLLRSLAGTILEEWEFAAPVSGTTTNNMLLTQPAGAYEVIIAQAGGNPSFITRLRAPRDVPVSMVQPARVNRAFSVTFRGYFKVPAGLTRIGMTGKVGTGSDGIRFFDSTGAAVTTNYFAPNFWWADVPVGQDDQTWSCDGYQTGASNVVLWFENCPNVIAFHPDQLLVPSELL